MQKGYRQKTSRLQSMSSITINLAKVGIIGTEDGATTTIYLMRIITTQFIIITMLITRTIITAITDVLTTTTLVDAVTDAANYGHH